MHPTKIVNLDDAVNLCIGAALYHNTSVCIDLCDVDSVRYGYISYVYGSIFMTGWELK